MSQPVPEAVLSNTVALHDATPVAPRGAGAYAKRRSPISRIFVHKSGANGPAGLEGALRMGKFVTAPEPQGRGWPGWPYTAWLSRVPDRDEQGRGIVYRLNAYETRSYHTGGDCNDTGIAVCIQGAYDGQWDKDANGRVRIENRPTGWQIEALATLLNHWSEKFLINLSGKNSRGEWNLSGHWESGKKKPACPGDAAREWVERRRGSLGPSATFHGSAEPGGLECSVEEAHRLLALHGFAASGDPLVWDYDSRAALEAFQRSRGLEPDGWIGPLTAHELRDPP